jgi:hypothetical protein
LEDLVADDAAEVRDKTRQEILVIAHNPTSIWVSLVDSIQEIMYEGTVDL